MGIFKGDPERVNKHLPEGVERFVVVSAQRWGVQDNMTGLLYGMWSPFTKDAGNAEFAAEVCRKWNEGSDHPGGYISTRLEDGQ